MNRAVAPARQASLPYAWMLLLLGAVVVYLTGLDNLYLPSNGDEMVYSHIARLTAESGHWLPLVSDLDHMRNTKPPLLFWQAMVAGDWGHHWDLWRLRLPAVLYTLLLTAAVATAGWLFTQRADTALIAACVYLAFFSTFRYGRPYLTSAAETFWLSLPIFSLLWRAWRPKPAVALPGWGLFTLWGLAWGLGLAYKSFALIVPAAGSLWCALLLLYAPWQQWPANRAALLASTWRISLAVAWSALLAVAVFSLWFALDSDPAAVWREFVVNENAGKLLHEGWRSALSGTVVQALAYVENAGPLALIVVGLGLQGLLWAYRGLVGHRETSADARPGAGVPVAWLLVWLMVFCIPTQRSARYVIPAMPALALLIALYWTRIGRGWFLGTLLLCLPLLALLARTTWAMHSLGAATDLETSLAAATLLLGCALIVAGLWRKSWSRACAIAAVLTVLAQLNCMLAPFASPTAEFGDPQAQALQGKRVAVPNAFNGQYERYQFLLPNNHFIPYSAVAESELDTLLRQLLQDYDAVVWQQVHDAPPPCAHGECRLLASRWDMKSRHQPGEVRLDNLFYPQQWLLRKEFLLVKAN